MSSIYDERQEMHSAKELARVIRGVCVDVLRQKNAKLSFDEVDERVRHSQLAVNWPGDDLVRQIVMDTVALIRNYELDINKIEW